MFMNSFNKITIIGTGFVGSTTAYTLMISGLASEIVLIDINKSKTEGEVMDLNHGMPFVRPVRISSGGYKDSSGSDIIIISAGANQKPGETRIDLVTKNTAIFKSIISEVVKYNDNCILLVGVNVFYHSVVGDNPKRLKECFDLALGRSDAIIMTGGLGPTKDDLTKETVAQILGLKLVLHEESLEIMKAFFDRLNRKMTDNNIKQAYLPDGSIIIKNSNGTAPGCIIEKNGKVVIMLPGPPSEMKPMFEQTVIPYFMNKSSYRLESVYMRIFGIGESAMEHRLIDLIDNQSNPTIAPYAKEGEVTLRLTARYEADEGNRDIITPVIDEIKRRLGNTVYSTENKNIEEVAAELLISSGTTISVAESCTGGGVSSRLTDIPGISKVFNRGIVSYSNEAKIENLGVKPETLDKYGAVSRETAEEMAQGMQKAAGTDIAVSITGIAGPDGGTAEKPVGLVYIALADKNTVVSRQLKLWGGRSRIRNVTALHVFDMIRRYLLKLPIEE